LFGTVDDLALYAKLLMGQGKLLKPETIKVFTDPVDVPPKGKRSLGWDVDTSYSGLRGEGFKAGVGFGHTGFTGTSLWIDPPSKTAIIILSNRVHPDDKGNASELRRKIATIVAESAKK
jgi:CubicO group peptidase (beta-lactamase class C family)